MSMTHGTNGNKSGDEAAPPHPPSSHGSTSSSGSSKHVKCIGRYVITGSLGKGNFARVESAVHTLTRAKVAIKIIETDKIKEEYVRKNLLREAQLMRRLRHPNIIRLYETMKTNNLYCLVTEIAEGGELLSHVRSDFKEKRLSEATTRPFIRQLVSALYHLHSVGIVHRDLKMENILLDKRKRQVKIVDFGLSNAAKPGSLLQTHCGSPEYAAPELFIPGREYGPEVDVWSLGVNMYAMLVGKLPFRSPRQGNKRRQKLLEQISAGLTDNHEREMEHISKGARDLIQRLLQPDPHKRTGLDEVMLHPWITKEGTQPLVPFKYVPPDAGTQMKVVDLMSTVLEVSPADIRETVRRDRCDWLAAIYNLLIDQPEGYTIIQRLITDDPEEQLVDAAHYQGSMEHFRLSQGDSLNSYPPDVANMLYSATAHLKRAGYRGSLSQPQQYSQSESGDYPSSTLPLTRREKQRHSSQEPQPLGAPRGSLGPVHPPSYLMRRSSIASPVSSPEHQAHGQYIQHPLVPHGPEYMQHQQQPLPPPETHPPHHPHPHHHHHHSHHQPHHKHSQSSRKGKRVLPMTPNEEPYQHPPPESIRPHSRAESAPDPLPVPWRSTLAPHSQLVVPIPLSPTSPNPVSPAMGSPMEEFKPAYPYKEPVVVAPQQQQLVPKQQPHPHPHPHAHGRHKSASKKNLSLLRSRPKSVSMGAMTVPGNLSKSIDGLNLKPAIVEQPGGMSWHRHKKIVPMGSKRHSEGMLRGWGSAQRLGQPADIQAMMQRGQGMPSASYNTLSYPRHKLDTNAFNGGVMNQEMGSDTSVEIRHEMFTPGPSVNTSPGGSKGSSPLGPSPQASNYHFRSPSDSFKMDPVSQKQRRVQQHHMPIGGAPSKSRAVSAKRPAAAEQRYMANHTPEHSASMKYVGTEQQRHHNMYPHDLPSLEDPRPEAGQQGRRKSKSSLKDKSLKQTN